MPWLQLMVTNTLTLCIKAPEEHSHSHHEQGVEVDHSGPARILTDVL